MYIKFIINGSEDQEKFNFIRPHLDSLKLKVTQIISSDMLKKIVYVTEILVHS